MIAGLNVVFQQYFPNSEVTSCNVVTKFDKILFIELKRDVFVQMLMSSDSM